MFDAAVVVFDGIRASNVEKWRGMMNDLARRGIAVIVVSSEGVRFHEGDSQDIMKLEFFLPSWTVEEYQAACRDDNFWRSCYDHTFMAEPAITVVMSETNVMGNKFTVAGHSARFMFKSVEYYLSVLIINSNSCIIDFKP